MFFPNDAEELFSDELGEGQSVGLENIEEFFADDLGEDDIADLDVVESFFADELGVASADDLATAEAVFHEELQESPNKRESVPAGIDRTSQYFFQFIANKRWQKDKYADSDSYMRLANAWDMMPRRHGDLADRPRGDDEKRWTHANTHTMAGWIRGAFRELSKGAASVKGKVSIDSTRHALEGLSSVASCVSKLYRQGAEFLKRDLEMKSKPRSELMMLGLVHSRHFDASPMLLRSGNLKERLSPMAKYLKKVEPPSPGRAVEWKLLDYKTWRQENPTLRTPDMGVLEVSSEDQWPRKFFRDQWPRRFFRDPRPRKFFRDRHWA